MLFCEPNGRCHRHRVSCVEATRDVDGLDVRHDFGIVAEPPVAEAFAKIDIDVDACGRRPHLTLIRHLGPLGNHQLCVSDLTGVSVSQRRNKSRTRLSVGSFFSERTRWKADLAFGSSINPDVHARNFSHSSSVVSGDPALPLGIHFTSCTSAPSIKATFTLAAVETPIFGWSRSEL